MVGNFEEVRSALGSTSIGNQAFRNSMNELGLAGSALGLVAKEKADQYRADLIKQTKGMVQPAMASSSSSPLNQILGGGLSLAKGIFEANQNAGNTAGSSIGGFDASQFFSPEMTEAANLAGFGEGIDLQTSFTGSPNLYFP